ncbi:MAG TPA: EscU/YscU/HrcU family type III secretion system export apparatus switch protein [Terracidiphilus sp.]|nr:EscU/YscU/HrcU family type III secretion system export apparatus switch protein [Terracidiphilus sp.]
MPGERTEQASQHRREKARKEGDILYSRELAGAAGTLAGALLLGAVGMRSVEAWRAGYEAFLDLGSPAHWESAQLMPTVFAIRRISLNVLEPVAMVMVAVAAAAVGVGMLQTGGVNLHPETMAFKVERLNPAENVKNLFSMRSAARLGKSLIPAALLCVFAAQRIGREMTMPPFSSARLEQLGTDIYGLLLTTAWILFGWSAIDFLVEWRSRESRLKMSREDLREEFKETEGSPEIRSRIKGLQRQMRRKRVKADVSRAAVVVTNPTHYAIALGFDFSTMETPKLLAKGRNLLAEEIKTEARWAGVPIVENPPLARSLYRAVEVGQAIPVDLYAAVASILAYLYRQRMEDEARERRMREAEARRRAGAGAYAAGTGDARSQSARGAEPSPGVIPPYEGGRE